MQYATLKNGHLAVLINDQLVDLVTAAQAMNKTTPASTMMALIKGGDETATAAKTMALDACRQGIATQPYSDTLLKAPITPLQRNIFCIGKNYVDHVAEVATKMQEPVQMTEYPVVFTKATSSLLEPGGVIPRHASITQKIDYAAEMAIIIGIGGRHIDPQDAWQHVFGYCCFNDVSERDLQQLHGQWHIGKSLDGFGPMGPVITTVDAMPAAADIWITCHVNGVLRQRANAAQMIFDIPTIIATLSAGITLQPGDVIATGTPAGVGMGFTPNQYLQSGDKVMITVAKAGQLVNYLQ
jgi:2-keto-4-pentenoate hydratase/2-oxohepta-3-ene-1,7-dioic acid hydratase in catechol pathway